MKKELEKKIDHRRVELSRAKDLLILNGASEAPQEYKDRVEKIKFEIESLKIQLESINERT